MKIFYTKKVDEKHILNWLVGQIFQNIFTWKLYEKLKLYPSTLGLYQLEIYLNAYLNMWLFKIMKKKSKNFLVLIITLNNIHEFNILRYILWILSKKLTSVFDWHTLPCLCPLRCVFFLLRISLWERRPNIVHCQWTQLQNFQWNGLFIESIRTQKLLKNKV